MLLSTHHLPKPLATFLIHRLLHLLPEPAPKPLTNLPPPRLIDPLVANHPARRLARLLLQGQSMTLSGRPMAPEETMDLSAVTTTLAMTREARLRQLGWAHPAPARTKGVQGVVGVAVAGTHDMPAPRTNGAPSARINDVACVRTNGGGASTAGQRGSPSNADAAPICTVERSCPPVVGIIATRTATPAARDAQDTHITPRPGVDAQTPRTGADKAVAPRHNQAPSHPPAASGQTPAPDPTTTLGGRAVPSPAGRGISDRGVVEGQVLPRGPPMGAPAAPPMGPHKGVGNSNLLWPLSNGTDGNRHAKGKPGSLPPSGHGGGPATAGRGSADRGQPPSGEGASHKSDAGRECGRSGGGGGNGGGHAGGNNGGNDGSDDGGGGGEDGSHGGGDNGDGGASDESSRPDETIVLDKHSSPSNTSTSDSDDSFLSCENDSNTSVSDEDYRPSKKLERSLKTTPPCKRPRRSCAVAATPLPGVATQGVGASMGPPVAPTPVARGRTPARRTTSGDGGRPDGNGNPAEQQTPGPSSGPQGPSQHVHNSAPMPRGLPCQAVGAVATRLERQLSSSGRGGGRRGGRGLDGTPAVARASLPSSSERAVPGTATPRVTANPVCATPLATCAPGTATATAALATPPAMAAAGGEMGWVVENFSASDPQGSESLGLDPQASEPNGLEPQGSGTCTGIHELRPGPPTGTSVARPQSNIWDLGAKPLSNKGNPRPKRLSGTERQGATPMPPARTPGGKQAVSVGGKRARGGGAGSGGKLEKSAAKCAPPSLRLCCQLCGGEKEALLPWAEVEADEELAADMALTVAVCCGTRVDECVCDRGGVAGQGQGWIHAACLLWSPQGRDEGGQLKGAAEALKAASRCCACRKKGATLGCRVEKCERVYHYPCARKVADMSEGMDMPVLCPACAVSSIFRKPRPFLKVAKKGGKEQVVYPPLGRNVLSPDVSGGLEGCPIPCTNDVNGQWPPLLLPPGAPGHQTYVNKYEYSEDIRRLLRPSKGCQCCHGRHGSDGGGGGGGDGGGGGGGGGGGSGGHGGGDGDGGSSALGCDASPLPYADGQLARSRMPMRVELPPRSHPRWLYGCGASSFAGSGRHLCEHVREAIELATSNLARAHSEPACGDSDPARAAGGSRAQRCGSHGGETAAGTSSSHQWERAIHREGTGICHQQSTGNLHQQNARIHHRRNTGIRIGGQGAARGASTGQAGATAQAGLGPPGRPGPGSLQPGRVEPGRLDPSGKGKRSLYDDFGRCVASAGTAPGRCGVVSAADGGDSDDGRHDNKRSRRADGEGQWSQGGQEDRQRDRVAHEVRQRGAHDDRRGVGTDGRRGVVVDGRRADGEELPARRAGCSETGSHHQAPVVPGSTPEMPAVTGSLPEMPAVAAGSPRVADSVGADASVECAKRPLFAGENRLGDPRFDWQPDTPTRDEGEREGEDKGEGKAGEAWEKPGKLMGGRCAYDAYGRVLLKPGYMIIECNGRCLCGPECLNRVVQKGIWAALELFMTKGKGWGVRTRQFIPKGRFVMEYCGEVVDWREAHRRSQDTYNNLFVMDGHVDKCDKSADHSRLFSIDPTLRGNISRFLNHGCRGKEGRPGANNLECYPVLVDHANPELHRCAFFAFRDIQPGEELLYDYQYTEEPGDTDGPGSPRDARGNEIECECGALDCRLFLRLS
eukprot:jgi/Mesvir1/10656/Mv13747-RA.1